MKGSGSWGCLSPDRRGLSGVCPLPLRRGRVVGPRPSLLRESSATRSIFILEAGSPSKNLRSVSTRDPLRGVSLRIFLSASSMAAAVASVARVSASSWARGASCSRCCCSRTFPASRALSSASVLAFSSATFRRVVSMASGFTASAWGFISASFRAPFLG